jgi:hypothetical protein
MNVKHAILALLGAGLVLSACGSSSKHNAGGNTTTQATTTATSGPTTTVNSYRPNIVPADFSTNVTNSLFPLKPGTVFISDGTRDGKPNHNEMTVTNETKVIMGVRCVVVRDVVSSNGALIEKTTDWYAQAKNGDVWYFGEATAEYVNGAISNTQGSWEGGVDNAQPGIIMKANPRVGDQYRQESRPGQAEDRAQVLKVGQAFKTPVRTYTNVIITKDTDPLNPSRLDTKYYGPGGGLIYTKKTQGSHVEIMTLTKVTAA